MVVPDPPLSWKQNKDDLILTASTHSPTPAQRFSQFNGSSSPLNSQRDSAIPDEDIVTNTEESHLSNLALFARSKTRSESVWADIYSRYSEVRTGSQRSSNSCRRKNVRNKNLNFDVKYGIACAIPELYVEDTYSCQDSDTPVSYFNHNISVGVNDVLASSRYKTSNFPLISVEKGPQHQEEEGEGTLFYQSTYNTQDLPESSSVASGSSKKSLKNKNSKLRKEAFSASRTESVKPFICLYGKTVHTDDCKCFKINLWKKCLLPGCHLEKVSNTDTFCNIYQNSLDEDVYDKDKHVSSLGEEITADTSIAVSKSISVTENIHSDQSCTQKLEPVCESAKDTDNQRIQYGLETDWGIGEEITQQYNSEVADLRVISPETALPLIHQTPNYSPREQSQIPFVSESESLNTFRHTYDNVKNLPFETGTSAWFKGKVQQVTEPSPRSTWSKATSGLAQSLCNVADFVQNTRTKNNIKSSERPAKENDLESCLALFDNLLIDIDNHLERKVPHISENSIAEQLGVYPWAALNSQSTTTMASQGKKNKNQFVRKAAPASPVNNTDVTSKEMRLAEVSIDCSSHVTSQKDMNVTNKIELTQGSPPEFVLEQHGMPPDVGVHDAHHLLGQNSSLGGISTPSVNIHYSDQLSSVPRIHSHPYSSPSTGSTMHSETDHDKTQSPVPPAKPPRTFVSDSKGQHSASSTHKEAQLESTQIFSNIKKQQSSRLQRQGNQQFANNFDDDGQGYHERLATDNPLTASYEDIQFKYLEEQARIQYDSSEIWINNGQTGNKNQSTHLHTQVGQDFPFHMNAQEQGQYISGHLGNKTHYSSKEHKESGHHKGLIPRVPNAGKMGQTSSSHQDTWKDEMQIGQSGGQMEQQQSWQHRGYHGDGQQERLGQMPDTEHGKSLQPAQRGLDDGIVGPMHSHAQLNEMQVNEERFNENVLGLQNQQSSKVQDRNIPKDHRHGNDQSGDGVSDYTRKSTYISDRELAQDQFDQRMNNPWFQEMVQNMKELVEREGLIVKDVFPDGNCLFTAVVDQLRVRGNFKYTPSTLRAAAVNYLIENSKQRDGTPLEHFLSNETWEHYLDRMSRDGEWGEHIILGAISEVLRCRINVLGGISGKTFTVVQPQYMSDKEEEEREKERKETSGGETTSDSQTADISENPTAVTDKSDKSPSKDETNSETSQSKTISNPAAPHTCEQSKSLHTGSASLPKLTEAKVEGTDTSQRKDQTAFCSKQNWDKENEELSQGEALFIGLLGEMHYVSLRKKDWEERLHEKLWARIQKREAQRKERSEEGSLSDDDLFLPEDPLVMLSTDIVVDPASGEHLPHLDFILKLLSDSPFVKTYSIDPHSFDECSVHCAEYTKQTVGCHIGELERLPSIDQPHVRTFFPMESLQGAVHNQPTRSLEKSVILAHYFSPHDTKIIIAKKGNARKDQFELVLETNPCHGGYVKLCPVNSNFWGNNLVSDKTGRLYLKHIHVNTKWNATGSETTIIPSFISFVCPWPSQAKNWFTRERPSKWICTCATKCLKDSCHVIPVSHNTSSESEIEWKLSFTVAEDWVINHCLKQFRVKVFHVLKFLVSTLVKEEIEGLRDVIRHTFFHACDIINENHFDERPARCILYIITDLLHKLLSGFVPHYFMTTINLIDHLSEATKTSLVKKLKLLRYNPTMYIYIFLDSYRLMYTELSNEFNSMIDDSQMLFLHGDIQQSKRQFFIPKYIRRICDLIKRQMYDKAEKECIAAFEEMTSVDNVISFNDWVEQVLIKLPITDRWCFAFYLDHSHQSCLLKHVCERLPTEPLINLFGPDIVCNMKELNVPSQSVCQQYVIDFVEKFTNSLCSLGLHYEVIVALKFFLTLIYDHTTGVYTYRNMSLETVHHSDCGSHSCATCSCHKVPQDHANLTRIALLYQRFYSSCCQVKKMDAFQPFQQRFGLICETLASQHFYNILSEMHERYERRNNEEGRQQMPVKETMI